MEDEGWVQGYFGILPVSFCVWCYSSMLDMVEKLTLSEDDQEDADDT
jgi:TRAP-type C4-dicarboxylate transport system permease small subunit